MAAGGESGVPAGEIVGLLPVEPVVTAWQSGSWVEGLAHAHSDVDIYCAVERLDETFAWTRRDRHRAVWVTIEGDRRIDFEYWTLTELERIATRLGAIPLEDPETNLLNYLSATETEVVHRIKVGVPLIEESVFDRIRESFDFGVFRRYLVRNALHYVDDAFDDTVGMHRSGDLDSAALRARATLGFSVDALLAAHDVTNNKAKFRLEMLRALAARHPELGRYWRLYREAALAIPLDGGGQVRFVEQALELSSEIVDLAERTRDPDAPRSEIDLESRPKRVFSVRKRRNDGRAFLIHGSELYSIDDFGESLWELADGTRSVLDILKRVADRLSGSDRVEIVERTLRITASLRNLGLLTVEPREVVEP